MRRRTRRGAGDLLDPLRTNRAHDFKSDPPNLLLSFTDFDPSRFVPWVEADHPSVGLLDAAVRLAEQRRVALFT
ncbi:MAG: hypothetical protein MUF54_16555 [Polyangiaceae bacterium]|nr:hypothetical protein [Polyangiaceae bacterium]